MLSDIELVNLSPIAVMVEDPGAVNFLAPLVDRLVDAGVSVIVFGVGVGANQLRERGHIVATPPSGAQVLEYLRAHRPSLLVIGTSEDPHTPAFRLLHAARLAGVPTVGVVDASVNAAFRFRGSGDVPLANVPDWLIVPDDPTASAFAALGFCRSRIGMVGNPARDLARERGKAIRIACRERDHSQRCPLGPPRIVFVSELSEGLNASQYLRSDAYTLTGRKSSQTRTAIVVEELLDAREDLRNRYRVDTTLVLRLHPKQDRSDLGSLCDEFDEVSSGGDPLHVVAPADLVVGMTSMLLLQAYDIGVPCLSLLPREVEKSWLPEIAVGAIPSVTTRNGLTEKIGGLLAESSCDSLECDTAVACGNSIENMLQFLLKASLSTSSWHRC